MEAATGSGAEVLSAYISEAEKMLAKGVVTFFFKILFLYMRTYTRIYVYVRMTNMYV